MAVSFYDNAKTGKVHFRADAGGGSTTSQTSVFDVPATPALIEKHRAAYDDYVEACKNPDSPNIRYLDRAEAQKIYVAHLESAVVQARATIEKMTAEIAEKASVIADLEKQLTAVT